VPYFFDDSTVRLLIIARTVKSLHVDVEIVIENGLTTFNIINTYGGYNGFEFSEIISINPINKIYSHFILLYKGDNPSEERSLITYYQYN
jgi:hypothetical protein